MAARIESGGHFLIFVLISFIYPFKTKLAAQLSVIEITNPLLKGTPGTRGKSAPTAANFSIYPEWSGLK